MRERLYDPCRRQAGYDVTIARDGIPNNSLKEMANRIAANINNVAPRFLALQLRYLRIKLGITKAKAVTMQYEINRLARKGKLGTHHGTLPEDLKSTVNADLEKRPQIFFKVMWRMNCLLAEKVRYPSVYCCSERAHIFNLQRQNDLLNQAIHLEKMVHERKAQRTADKVDPVAQVQEEQEMLAKVCNVCNVLYCNM